MPQLKAYFGGINHQPPTANHLARAYLITAPCLSDTSENNVGLKKTHPPSTQPQPTPTNPNQPQPTQTNLNQPQPTQTNQIRCRHPSDRPPRGQLNRAFSSGGPSSRPLWPDHRASCSLWPLMQPLLPVIHPRGKLPRHLKLLKVWTTTRPSKQQVL